MALYPQDCPVFEYTGGGHWHKTHVQIVDAEPDELGWLRIWHTCRLHEKICHAGHLLGLTCLRPLTPAAQELLDHLKVSK